MINLIFNADDFGYSKSVNYGILDSFDNGVLRSTTIMTNAYGFEHAVELAKQNPNLGVGVHLTLTFGKPLLEKKNTLTDENGYFYKLKYYEAGNIVDEEELFNEWDEQIKKVINSGINPTHLDSHHHIHTFGTNQNVVIKLAKKYNLPVRGNFELKDEVVSSDYFDDKIDQVGYIQYNENYEQNIKKIVEVFLKNIEGAQTVEIMCHPAYLGVELYNNSSFALPRINQADFLMNSSFAKELISSNQFKLCNYNILKEK